MPEEREQPKATAERQREAPAVPPVDEFGRLVSAASALQVVQAQAALEAMKLPDQRLDDASDEGGAPGYTLRDDGDGKFTKVDSEGREVKG
jgi:hypothetical protein